MKRPKNQISEAAAINLLKRLYANYPNKVEITLEEAYKAAGRSGLNPETNRNWLNGVLVKLKSHQLITTVSKFENSRSKLDKLRLTLAGRAALGMSSDSIVKDNTDTARRSSTQHDVTYSDVAKVVKIFRDSNPDYEITFEVKLKEVSN